MIARQIVRLYAKRTDDIQHFASMSLAAGWIETTMVIPGNFAVVIFGVIYGLMIDAPILGFLQGATRNWLLVSNILLVTGFLNVPLISAVFAVPRGKLFDAALKDTLAGGEMTPELRAHIDDPVVRLAHWFELTAIVAIVFLMMIRPF